MIQMIRMIRIVLRFISETFRGEYQRELPVHATVHVSSTRLCVQCTHIESHIAIKSFSDAIGSICMIPLFYKFS